MNTIVIYIIISIIFAAMVPNKKDSWMMILVKSCWLIGGAMQMKIYLT